MLIKIEDLHASIQGTKILKGLNLSINAGEIHAIMGPNGSGKSTLSKILVGYPGYEITQGKILYNGEDILDWEPEERANKGMFLAFQYPVEIPGVNNASFLRLAYNAKQKSYGQQELDPLEFEDFLKEKLKLLQMDAEFTQRAVNEGFSGGEKKRNEILQMAVLDPKLAILDETDSGLDIDSLRIVSDAVNALRRPDNAFVLVTHYQRLLDHIQPDFIHVLYDGRIIKSGDKSLALELEERGYDWLIEAAEKNELAGCKA